MEKSRQATVINATGDVSHGLFVNTNPVTDETRNQNVYTCSE